MAQCRCTRKAQISNELNTIRNAKQRVANGNRKMDSSCSCFNTVTNLAGSIIDDGQYGTAISQLTQNIKNEADHITRQLNGKEYALEQEYKDVSNEDRAYHEEQDRLIREAEEAAKRAAEERARQRAEALKKQITKY